MLVAALAAGSLGFINQLTRPVIAENERLSTEKALRQVFSQADSFREVSQDYADSLPEAVSDLRLGQVDDKPMAAVYTLTGAGYNGDIKLMVSFHLEKKTITGLRILQHTETPGLGANLVQPPFYEPVAGKDASAPLSVVKNQEASDHEIVAITAATITSRAVVDTINLARKHFEENLDRGGDQ